VLAQLQKFVLKKLSTFVQKSFTGGKRDKLVFLDGKLIDMSALGLVWMMAYTILNKIGMEGKASLILCWIKILRLGYLSKNCYFLSKNGSSSFYSLLQFGFLRKKSMNICTCF